METLQNIVNTTDIAILSAFLMGIMAALSPCTLATNITAIAFIGKNIEQKRSVFFNGLLYTLGRAISYFSIAAILYFGASKFHIAGFFTKYGEKFVGPLLILIGLIMLDVIRFKLPGFEKLTERIQNREGKSNAFSSLLLGIIFALAFCPYCAMIFFGMLIPITIASPSGLMLPLVFAFATGLPVIIFSFLIAYTFSSVGTFYNKLKVFEKWVRKVVAIIFLLVGFYFIIELIFHHH